MRQTLAMILAFAGGLSSFASGAVLAHQHESLGRGGILGFAVVAGLVVQVCAAAYAFTRARKPTRVTSRLPVSVPLEQRKH